MAYPTVTINSNDFSVYGSQNDADSFLAASITATAWAAAVDLTKQQALVSTARWFNNLNWIGAKADGSQDLAWPRTGVPNVDSSTIPTGVVYASFETAAALVDDPTLFTSINDPLIASMGAGPVNVTYFRPHDVQWLGPVPKAALAYIAAYLGGSSSGPISSGTCGESALDRPYDFRHGL